MWYFAENGDRKGPVTPEEMQALVESGKLGLATLVWREGFADWLPLAETELRDLLPTDLPFSSSANPVVPLPAPEAGAVEPISTAAVEAKIQQLNTWFAVHWIGLVVGLALKIGFLRLLGIIVGAVFGALLFYQFWKVIQDGDVRTTPGRAVGFMFIPLFNIYWQFVAVWGLAKDANAYIKQRNISTPPLREGRVLIQCILSCFTWMPSLGILIAIASLALWILNVKAFKDTAIAILRSRVAA